MDLNDDFIINCNGHRIFDINDDNQFNEMKEFLKELIKVDEDYDDNVSLKKIFKKL